MDDERGDGRAGRFGGRVALVTGAGSGIGAAVAARLARQGAEVFAADIDGIAIQVDQLGMQPVAVTDVPGE
ncbi:SDR family NAD(P)-dependent oxidoreductase [Streptomyces sp. NBC_00365]|uniref:SDR family NAD(P)-dependent oxidoreductase n=1 Tax=Streptomyces sp. NBC_00365 TaxID=2975726 RepID=UPI002B1D9887|nr:SDR family NAD(P)-dependent oxidoreductase [Streptomyces sp. NBC_00365]